MSARSVTAGERVVRQGCRVVGVPAEQDGESLHRTLDAARVPRRQEIEYETGHGGDGQRCRDVVDSSKGLVEPIVDRVLEKIRVAVGVAKSQPVCLEEEPHERTLFGI